MTEIVTEARAVTITEGVDSQSGTFEIMLITPGMGSSGWYAREVIEAAGKTKSFPAKTPLYLDHPSASEEINRPERSVRDLAGVLLEDARWNGEGLVAKAKIYSTYRPLLAEAAEDIGMSVRATADISEGTRPDGSRGRIVNRIDEGISVDFVTKAGRGGKVLAVIESARDDGRAAYAVDESGAVTLAHETAREIARTEQLSPVIPAGSTTQESQGGRMTDIAESVADLKRQLSEAAGRAQALEAERDTATAERDAARSELAEHKARESAVKRARAKVTEVNGTLDAPVVERIVEAATRTVPMTADGVLDETALDAAAESARVAEETYLAGLGARVGSVGVPAGDAAGLPDVSEAATYLDKLNDRIAKKMKIGAR